MTVTPPHRASLDRRASPLLTHLLRLLTPLSVGAGLLLAAATQASAQVSCPGVCVGYSTTSAVPLTPGAMALLAGLLGVVALVALRRQQTGNTWLGLVLAAVVGVGGYGWQMREASADGNYTVVLTAGTNPGTVTIPDSFGGGVDVSNTLSTPITVISLSFSPALTGRFNSVASPVHVGSSVAANSTVTNGLVFCPPDQILDPGSGTCISG